MGASASEAASAARVPTQALGRRAVRGCFMVNNSREGAVVGLGKQRRVGRRGRKDFKGALKEWQTKGENG